MESEEEKGTYLFANRDTSRDTDTQKMNSELKDKYDQSIESNKTEENKRKIKKSNFSSLINILINKLI